MNASRVFSRTTDVAITPTFDVPLSMSRWTRPTLYIVKGSTNFSARRTVFCPPASVMVTSTTPYSRAVKAPSPPYVQPLDLPLSFAAPRMVVWSGLLTSVSFVASGSLPGVWPMRREWNMGNCPKGDENARLSSRKNGRFS